MPAFVTFGRILFAVLFIYTGAARLFAMQATVDFIAAKVVVRDVDILESSYQGVLMSFQKAIRDVLFERVTIKGAGTYGIEIDATGTATFNAVTVTGAASGGANIGSSFTVTKGPGNVGW